MIFHSLRVYHFLKSSSAESPFVPAPAFLDSCLRKIWLSEDNDFPCSKGLEIFAGEKAYSFLLRVAAGLESEVIGETDIFGQMKAAWKSQNHLQKSSLFSKCIPYLFEDTKEIRTRWIEGLGGASYGSLVRRLLRPAPNETIFIVGAGKLAHSVAPYFSENPVWLWNRSVERLHDLRDELLREFDPKNHESTVLEIDEEARAWRDADHIVVCVPEDTARDVRRIQWWREGKPDRKILHLGMTRCGSRSPWSRVPNFATLEAVFELEKSQRQLRSEAVRRALRACDERARLRSVLGGALNQPHGWEDLMAVGE